MENINSTKKQTGFDGREDKGGITVFVFPQKAC